MGMRLLTRQYAGLFGATANHHVWRSISDYYNARQPSFSGSTEIYGEPPPNTGPKPVDPSTPLLNFHGLWRRTFDPFANSLGIVFIRG